MAKQRAVEIVLKAVDKTGAAFKSVDSNIDKTGKTAGQSSKAMTGIGIAAAAAALVTVAAMAKITTSIIASIKAATKLGDDFDKMSKRIDVSVESLSDWSFIIKRAGGDISVLETAFRGLARQMKAAQDGTTLTVDAFGDLGVEFANADGSLRGVEETFNDLISALSKHTNEAEKSAFALQFFGRAGLGLKPVINQTNAELEKQRQLVIDIGGVYSKEYTDGAAAMTDAFDLLERQSKSLERQFIATYGQDIAVLVEELAKQIGAVKKEIGESVTPAENLMLVLATSLDAEIQKFKDLSLEMSLLKTAMEVAPKGGGVIAAIVASFADDPTASMVEFINSHSDLNLKLEELTGTYTRFADALKESKEQGGSGGGEVEIQKSVNEELELQIELRKAWLEWIERGFAVEVEWLEWVKEMSAERAENAQMEHDRMMESMDEVEAIVNDVADMWNRVRDNIKDSTFEIDKAASRLILVGDSLRSFGESTAFRLLNGDIKTFNDLLGSAWYMISRLIAQLLFAKAIGFLRFSQGGQVPAYAQGGQVAKIPKAAFGYSVPDGPRGLDSRLIMAMPGEEVINRSMSRRLNRFLSAAESSAYVSPYDVVGSQGGGGSTVVMNVGIPQSQAGLVEMQQSVVEMLDDREKGVL